MRPVLLALVAVVLVAPLTAADLPPASSRFDAAAGDTWLVGSVPLSPSDWRSEQGGWALSFAGRTEGLTSTSGFDVVLVRGGSALFSFDPWPAQGDQSFHAGIWTSRAPTGDERLVLIAAQAGTDTAWSGYVDVEGRQPGAPVAAEPDGRGTGASIAYREARGLPLAAQQTLSIASTHDAAGPFLYWGEASAAVEAGAASWSATGTSGDRTETRSGTLTAAGWTARGLGLAGVVERPSLRMDLTARVAAEPVASITEVMLPYDPRADGWDDPAGFFQFFTNNGPFVPTRTSPTGDILSITPTAPAHSEAS